MSKRKGVSAEEKRTRMLQIFYEKKDFFQLKELEKIAPKEKGIIVQSVKDVIQSLVDDGLVDTDKIGTSVYFWAYPSKAKHSRKRKLEEMKKQIDEMDKKLKIAKEEFNSYQTNDEDEVKKADILTEIAGLRAKKLSLDEEVQMYRDHDPEVLEATKKNIKAIKEAANRWTDNIFTVKDWCKKKFSVDEGTLNKVFGIPTEFDYIN